ncbi:TetR/AcrR family transcriptional regulator [Nakamurella leprariae]|uniref:TetR/AcrR family transcriptional regulator n=1 Tax=Nakamurella leprariae TaxID=2803911 RepID=A0A938YAE0_9ACTN|nr:TetR/AcrR family transcriptional regulator [Nakamurella leprariae]MBM9468901.1 TetR/AcrR family transcriptional regulator [Nakamurella leprariae]
MGDPEPPRAAGRDAAGTRSALVRAARRRFATEGYRGATVRTIAADAGVNVALINRYFGSKEGLFEACLRRSVDQLDPQGRTAPGDLDRVVTRVVGHLADLPNADDPLQLLLLLRSSGDERADAIRRRMLEHHTEQFARVAGWQPDDPATAPLLLRAQVALGSVLGLVMLRTAIGVQPISSASADELVATLGPLLRTLLAP